MKETHDFIGGCHNGQTRAASRAIGLSISASRNAYNAAPMRCEKTNSQNAALRIAGKARK